MVPSEPLPPAALGDNGAGLRNAFARPTAGVRRAFHNVVDTTTPSRLAKPKHDPDDDKFAPKPRSTNRDDSTADDFLKLIDSAGELIDENWRELVYAMLVISSIMGVLWGVMMLRLSCTEQVRSMRPFGNVRVCSVYSRIFWVSCVSLVVLVIGPFIVPFLLQLRVELGNRTQHRGLAVRAACRRALRHYALWQENVLYRTKVSLGIRSSRPPRVSSI